MRNPIDILVDTENPDELNLVINEFGGALLGSSKGYLKNNEYYVVRCYVKPSYVEFWINTVSNTSIVGYLKQPPREKNIGTRICSNCNINPLLPKRHYCDTCRETKRQELIERQKESARRSRAIAKAKKAEKRRERQTIRNKRDQEIYDEKLRGATIKELSVKHNMSTTSVFGALERMRYKYALQILG